MSKQTFTAGQVLTAAEMNSLQENDYNWTVSTKTASYTLAAGDEGTRIVMDSASATTITVDDAIFSAGDTVWLHNIGAGTATVTAGTATVNTTGGLELAQYAGGQLFFTSASTTIFFPFGGGGAAMIKKVEAFTASGTWTVPTGVTYAIAHMLGGGGGGAAQTSAGGTGGTSSVAFAGGTVSALGGIGRRATGGGGFAGQPDEADNSGRGGVTNGGTYYSTDAQWVVAGDTVTPGASITVTVGAGGISGTGGNPGGEGGSGYVWIEYYEEA